MTQPNSSVSQKTLERLKNKASAGTQAASNPSITQIAQAHVSGGAENFGKHCFSRYFAA